MKRPTMVVSEVSRKWQHATVTIPIPPGWELNYEWGRDAPVKDLAIHHNNDGTLCEIVVGLRRPKEDAVPATKGELV